MTIWKVIKPTSTFLFTTRRRSAYREHLGDPISWKRSEDLQALLRRVSEPIRGPVLPAASPDEQTPEPRIVAS